MAKKALLDVLEKTIGKYVLNLDAESLNVAVWSGTIELNALELNVPAVNAELDRQAADAPNLALPFRVVSGSFESFHVDVPWSALTSRPVVLRARGLHVEMEPYDRAAAADLLLSSTAASALQDGSEAEGEAARAQKVREHREQSLRLADEYRQQANVLRRLAEQDLAASSSATSSKNPSASGGGDTFGARLVRRILENVQIEIVDVRVALRGAEGAAGVTLGSLRLVTTDSRGTRTFVDRAAATQDEDRLFLHKALAIAGLGAYLDDTAASATGGRSSSGSLRRCRPDESLVTKLPSIRESASGASSSHDDEGGGDYISNSMNDGHSYVLAPLSFEATLRQSDSNQCIDHPKYLLQSHVQNLSVLLSKAQLEVWQKIAAQIRPALDAPRPLFPEYRPASRVRPSHPESAREWWRYAGRCIGRLNGRRLWREFFRAVQKRKLYIPLYKRHRHADQCAWLAPLTNDELATLLDIEGDRSLSVEGIMTWRNIADAQVDKEREKDDAKRAAAAPKTSLFTTLFGSSAASKTNLDDDNEPPVSLTVEEMKALETITMEQVADSELSSDSKLADVKFVLGSLDVTLATHELSRQVAVLDMGTVATSFDVNADGSFLFDFSLRSLEILDRATRSTLYPSILKNQVRNSLSDLRNEAFRVHVAKTKTGDQHLQILLNTFEAVASPSLLLALQRFLSSSPVSYPSRPSSLNPLLAQSMSGSVDLFYDATEGTAVPKQIGVGDGGGAAGDLPSLPGPHGQDLSQTLIDAWKVKTETKAAWVVDLDIHAPILVLPENCVDPRANVVVFDLGQLRILYGKPEADGRVQQWCRDNPRAASSSPGAESIPILDSGSMAISNLTFVVGKNNYWQRLVRKKSSLDSFSSDEDTTVFEPASLSIEFGIESSKSEPVPRVCLFGTIPLISLKLSPSQLSRIKRVLNAWRGVVSELSPSPEPFDEPLEQMDPVNDAHSRASSRTRGLTLFEEARRGSALIAAHGPSLAEPTTVLFVDLRLQRLSLAVASEDGSGMEAHLVSAAVSFASISDSSSVGRLSMGWFWVVDRLKHELPRRQRYVIHSRLPKSPDELALDDTYDAIHDLKSQGVFEPNYQGSQELADISYKQRGSGPTSLLPGRGNSYQSLKARGADTTIDAKFSSLRVNWNPAAVKTILSTVNQYAALLDDNVSTEVGNVILSSPEQLRPRRVEQDPDDYETDSLSPMSLTRVTAVMEKFEVSLNSALDDLPLFLLSMSSANLRLTSAADNMELDVSLDDLRVETPICKRTDPLYRAVLGLSPGRSESLLKVQYVAGEDALLTVNHPGVSMSDLEAFARISISPMRLVYIQAQILALVEYSTEGILGALTAQAASSAAAAARELAASAGGKQKLFAIAASGLQALLPESASSRNFISVSTGSAVIEYTSLPDPGGGRASVRLMDVVLSDSADAAMQERPFGMIVSVSLPPDGVGSEDDQAMRVGIEIPESPLMLSKRQYAQILRSLTENIGQPDLCLRDEQSGPMVTTDGGIDSSLGIPFLQGMTHSGAAVVESQRRMYIDVVATSLSLLLCDEGPDDPIIRVDAVKAKISLQQFPLEGRMKAIIALSDLRCTDERIKAIGRQHRTLVYQANSNDLDKGLESLFTVEYESKADNSSAVNLSVGSPRVVFIPDAVSDVLSFFAADIEHAKSPPTADAGGAQPRKDSPVLRTEFAVETSFSDDQQVEATYVKRQARAISVMAIHLVTSRCSLILVDLGSNSILPSNVRFSKIAALSESIVFGGEFEARYSSSVEATTGNLVAMDAEFHGNHMEVYTAYGLDLDHPMQVLEPTQVTLYLASKNPGENDKSTVDIRAATLTPVDLALSMRNVALANAIVSSIFESFGAGDESPHEAKKPKHEMLDADQTREIERLAKALESAEEVNLSAHGKFGDASVDESPVSTSVVLERTISVKVTVPEATFSVINDLQGLDDALLRVTTRSTMINGQLREGERMTSSSTRFTAFDLMAHASVLADFYDEAKNKWRPLLLEPWELSTKSARAESNRFQSPRPSTTIDVESFPCNLTFSEQFLMSIASANRMWSVYATATASAFESESQTDGKKKRDSVSMSLAASAARTLTTSLPYAVENHTGVDVSFVVSGENDTEFICGTGTVEYFRFSPPKGSGSGGKRVYGQDLQYKKSVTLRLGSSEYAINDLDAAVGQPRQVHEWEDNVVVVAVSKEGKSVTVHLSSGVDVSNLTSIPMSVGVVRDSRHFDLFTCSSCNSRQSVVLNGGKASKLSALFGVPFDAMSQFWFDWKTRGHCVVPLVFNPCIDDLPAEWKLEGTLNLALDRSRFQTRHSALDQYDVECKAVCSQKAAGANRPQGLDTFVVHAIVSIELVGGLYPAVDIKIKPRAILENTLPISLSVRTPMPHTYSEIHVADVGKESVHYVGPKRTMEIFTPGPSVAVSMRCSESPVAGSPTDWMNGWVDLPLVSQFRIPEAIQCEFPFVRNTPDPLSLTGSTGCEFFVANGESVLIDEDDIRRGTSRLAKRKEIDGAGIEVSAPPDRDTDEWRRFIVGVYNYGVDHLGDLLFEQVESSTDPAFRRSNTDLDTHRTSLQPARQLSPPMGAFSSLTHQGRVSLLPRAHTLIRLLHLTMEGDEGIKRSQPFRVEDVAICDGGVDSTPLLWEDGTASGLYAYRNLVSTYQSEVHVIPEYVVFNGSKSHTLRVKQPGGIEVVIGPGRIAPLRTNARETATIAVVYEDLDARTSPLRVDSLALRIAIVKTSDGRPLGSLAMQTIVGSKDSRLVVKLGELKLGALSTAERVQKSTWLEKDFLRFRVQWTELRVTLDEGRPIVGSKQAFFETAMDRIREAASPQDTERQFRGLGPSRSPTTTETWLDARNRRVADLKVETDGDYNPVCTIVFSRFTVDWQRVFKDEEPSLENRSTRDALRSPERSQLSVIIHNVQLRDEMPNTPYPVVFDSTSGVSFFDLCIRCRGPLDSELVKVDLFDLNLAHENGVSQRIFVSTSEEFVWRLLDLANRIVVAAGELAGVDMELKWDEEQEGYAVSFRDKESMNPDSGVKYTPPSSDRLYDIARARVSPFTTIVSFKRTPQSSRYKLIKGVRGSNIMNYFTKRLKFKIDQAELKFARYEAQNIKGPPDRLLELLSTVYMSRAKLKLVTIMTATSFQDWKSLSSRDEGDDAFVEGDILRATGNIAGNTANYILRHAGRGIGQGVSNVTSTIGDGIENVTGALGVRALGAGVNSVVTGVGGGVADTISGVGSGAGKVLLGAGQGAGAVFGGLTGGALIIGKGVGKAITTGDGRAVVSGVSDGVSSLGAGVGQGIESVVSGTAEGVVSVGQGLFSGVKSVGKGITGAFRGKTPEKKYQK